MSDWAHCNKCYLQFKSSSEVKFSLSNCGHIYCDKCYSSGKPNYCIKCHKECSMMLLTSNLDSEILTFFNDPDNILNKYHKVVDFQKRHRSSLMEYIMRKNEVLEKKYAHARDYINKIGKQYKSLQEDNLRLRNYIKTSIHSIPGSGPSTPSTSFSLNPNSINQSNKFIIRGQHGSGINSPGVKKFAPMPPIQNRFNARNSLSSSSNQIRNMFSTPTNPFTTPTNSLLNSSIVTRPSTSSSINISRLNLNSGRNSDRK